MERGTRYWASGLVMGAAAMVPAAGCITIDWDGPGGSDANVVVIRLVNNSLTLAVEPLLYATGQAVVDPSTELFTGANKVGGIGFAGTGLIPKGETERVELTCSEARVLGTPGARFVDQKTGALEGTGPEKLLSQPLFDCGATITFTFNGRVGGDFDTNLKITGP